MIAFSKDYRPVLEVSPFFTIKDLESDLVKYLMNFGEEFEISHLGSYSKFSRKASDLAYRFISRGLPVTINIEDAEDLPRVISADAVFPSSFEQPYVEYFIDKQSAHYVRDISSPYAVIVSAVRRDGRLKGFEEKVMASKILNEIDEDGMINGEFLINPEDLSFARSLVCDFR